jgi:hypothetical protein
MARSSKSPKQLKWLVVPWGTVNEAELTNALYDANAAQGSFRFVSHREPLPLNVDKYLLPDGGYHLEEAAKELIQQPCFKRLPIEENLMLITSIPYSIPGAEICIVEGKNFPGYFNETDLTRDGRISLISTFLWDQLPPREDLAVVTINGRRVLSPYILLNLANIALDRFVKVPNHNRSVGCPNDYCDKPHDIDIFFEHGKWFCKRLCSRKINEAIYDGVLHTEQLKAMKRILNVARGKPANDGFDSCFISYGHEEPDISFVRRLQKDLKKRGIESWLWDTDNKPGDETWSSINRARHYADRMISVISSNSLKKEGFRIELKSQMREKRNKIIPLLLDEQCEKNKFNDYPELKAELKSLMRKNYADFVRREYSVALSRLIKALHWK